MNKETRYNSLNFQYWKLNNWAINASKQRNNKIVAKSYLSAFMYGIRDIKLVTLAFSTHQIICILNINERYPMYIWDDQLYDNLKQKHDIRKTPLTIHFIVWWKMTNSFLRIHFYWLAIPLQAHFSKWWLVPVEFWYFF